MHHESSHRSELVAFFAVLLVLSVVADAPMIARGRLESGPALLLMWSPGVAAMVAVLLFRRSLKPLGWRPGKLRYLAASVAVPVILALAVYGLVWLTGLGGFSAEGYAEGVQKSLGLQRPLPLVVALLLVASAGLLLDLVAALGEEIGWAGYLTPRMLERATFLKASLGVGLIWGVWHWPLILGTNYNAGTTGWVAIPCFTAMSVGFSFVRSWLWIRSRSLWTGALMHAAHNLVIQAVLDTMTVDTGVTRYLTTEFGVGLALAYAVVGYLCWRSAPRLRPAVETEAPVGASLGTQS